VSVTVPSSVTAIDEERCALIFEGSIEWLWHPSPPDGRTPVYSNHVVDFVKCSRHEDWVRREVKEEGMLGQQ